MAAINDYSLVLNNLQKILDESRYDGVFSFAPRLNVQKEISYDNPSIEFKASTGGLLMYDILVDNMANPSMILKWQSLSTKCLFLFIVVPEQIKKNIESICCSKSILNYSVIAYQIEPKGKNRNVNFIF